MVEAVFGIRAEDKTKAAFRSVNKSIGKLTKMFGGLAAGYAAFRIVGKTIDIHRKFSAAISDLSAITGAAGKDLEFLRKKSMEYGETTTLTATQAAEAFKLVASAKPDLLENAQALAAVTKEAIALAEASGSTLPEAAKTVTLALNQYSAGAEQAAKFINILAAGAKFGASEIADTSMALKDSGLLAASAGTSFEELNAAIQVLAVNTIKGSKAGVAMRNIYLGLLKQNNDQFKPSIVGLTQAFKNLKAANLGDLELMKIFEKETLIAAKAVINQAGTLDVLTEKLTGTTTAYEQAAIKVDNLDGDLKKLASAWEGVALQSTENDQVMRRIVQTMTEIAKVAKSLIIAFGDMGDAIGAYGAVAAAVATLDFDRASAILEMRREEAKLADEAIAKIWGEKAATEELNTAKTGGGAGGAGDPTQAESEKRAAEQLARDEADQIEYDKFVESLTKKTETLDLALLTEEERIDQSFQRRSATLEAAFMNDLITEDRFAKLRDKLGKKRDSDMLKAKDKNNKDGQKGALQNASAIFGIEKEMSIATIAAKAPQAISSAIANAGGLPFGAFAGIATAASMAAQLAAASGASLGGGGSVPSVSGGGGGSVPSVPSIPGTQLASADEQTQQRESTIVIEGLEPGEMFSGQQMRDLADRVAESNGGKVSFG